ncbi:hypothetical protein [Amycolatopsis marina]|nr:hypothetical protein [Amycolatopsis marina]
MPELEAANRRFIDRTAEGNAGSPRGEPPAGSPAFGGAMDGLRYDALVRPCPGGHDRAALRNGIDAIVRGILATHEASTPNTRAGPR